MDAVDFKIEFQWIVTSLLVIAGFVISFVQYRQRRHQQMLVDLQSDKAAVAAAAMRVQSGRFSRFSKRRRTELFEALCLAAVYETSGRSRSLIYSALAHVGEDSRRFRKEIQTIVDRVTEIVSRSWGYTELGKARHLLDMLRAALGVEGDIRVRLGRLDVGRLVRAKSDTPDTRLTGDIFAWRDLDKILREIDSLIMVCSLGKPKGKLARFFAKSKNMPVECPVLALDYHRAARTVEGKKSEELVLTEMGQLVVRAKYPEKCAIETGIIGRDATRILAGRLAVIVKAHTIYEGAKCVAAVPGSVHPLSMELGEAVTSKFNEAVAGEVRKSFVGMFITVAKKDGHPPAFAVIEADKEKLRGATVILVDDVYRSGRTLQAAAKTLMKAGANKVVGLTATATISATASHCSQDTSSSLSG